MTIATLPPSTRVVQVEKLSKFSQAREAVPFFVLLVTAGKVSQLSPDAVLGDSFIAIIFK